MNIRKLGYELYKIDWLRRISTDIKMDTVKNYYQEVSEEEQNDYSLDEYIWECGYGNGFIYVCEDEFLYAEYLDKEYMKGLFDNDELFAEYKKDLEENFYNN